MKKLSSYIIRREKTSNVGWRVWKICPICEKEFSRPECLKQRFCSTQCKNKHQKGKHHSPSTEFKKGNIPYYAGKKLPQWFKNKLSIARLESKYRTGKKHPRWKYGSDSYYRMFAKRVYRLSKQEKICKICKTNIDIVIHHLDGITKNNVITNLIPLCRGCHTTLHHLIRGNHHINKMPRSTRNYVKSIMRNWKESQ